MNSLDLQPTLGVEWRREREEGVLVQLPVSRRLVRLRTVRPDMLLRRGHLPDQLAQLIVNMIYGRASSSEMDAYLDPREQAEEAVEMMDGLAIVCAYALVEPRIVDEPIADSEIAVADLEYADMGYIFKLCFMPSDTLSRFRYIPQAVEEPVEQKDE